MVGMWPYTHGILGGAAAYTADAAAFDGVNDDIRRGAALTGAADGSEGILSFWFRINSTASDGTGQRILRDQPGNMTFYKSTTDTLQFDLISSTGGLSKRHYSTNTFTSTSAWHHALYTWRSGSLEGIFDGSTVAGSSVVASTRDIDYTSTDFAFGGRGDNTERCYMDFADVYFNFSTDGGGSTTILSKFYSGGKPVNLSTDGSTVTGTAPIIMFHLDDSEAVANFATNRGSGGNFTVTGTLVTSTSSPTD